LLNTLIRYFGEKNVFIVVIILVISGEKNTKETTPISFEHNKKYNYLTRIESPTE